MTTNHKTGSSDPPTQERNKVRLSLDITPELNDLLNDLAATIGGTKSDVLRKAIALMEIAVNAKRQGKKFGIAEKDQPLVDCSINFRTCFSAAACCDTAITERITKAEINLFGNFCYSPLATEIVGI